MSRQHEIPEPLGKHLRWITALIPWPYKMDPRTTFMDMSNWIKISVFNFPEGWGQKQVLLESGFQWRRECYDLQWRNTLNSCLWSFTWLSVITGNVCKGKKIPSFAYSWKLLIPFPQYVVILTNIAVLSYKRSFAVTHGFPTGGNHFTFSTIHARIMNTTYNQKPKSNKDTDLSREPIQF